MFMYDMLFDMYYNYNVNNHLIYYYNSLNNDIKFKKYIAKLFENIYLPAILNNMNTILIKNLNFFSNIEKHDIKINLISPYYGNDLSTDSNNSESKSDDLKYNSNISCDEFDQYINKQINEYKILKQINGRSNGYVYLCEKNNEFFAMKIVEQEKKIFNKSNVLIDKSNSLINNEIFILKKINHKNIIKLHDVIIDISAGITFIILTYCNCGTLLTKNDNNTYKILEKNKIIKYMNQIIDAISYLHSNKIIEILNQKTYY